MTTCWPGGPPAIGATAELTRTVAPDDITRFTQISEFEWKKLPRFLHQVFARGVRRDVLRQLQDLKHVLEAQQELGTTERTT